MSLIINADGEYLTGTGGAFATAGATQVTMAICVKRDSGTSTYQSYCAVAGDLTINYGAIGLAHNGGSVDCFIYPSGTEYRVDPSVNSNSTAWQWLIFTYEKDVASKVYTALVGGSVNSGTDGDVPNVTFNNALDEIRIGLGAFVQAGWFCRARLSHCAVWNTTLSPTQITDLVSGGAGGISKNPQAIANSNLTFYAPLTSDATVTIGGISLSATGTLTYDGADNPNVEAYGGGTPTLVIADSSHGHIADALVLTSQHSIVVAEAIHGHTADSISLGVLGTLAIDDAIHAHLADSITLTTTTPGVITIPAVKDWGTGNLKLGETGVQIDIRNKSTGALVVRKTGQTTHGTTGVCVVTDALIVIGIEYEVATRFSDGSMGMWDYTAA